MGKMSVWHEAMPAWYKAEMNTPCRRATRAADAAWKKMKQAKIDYDWAQFYQGPAGHHFVRNVPSDAEIESRRKAVVRAAARYHKRVEEQKAICVERR